MFEGPSLGSAMNPEWIRKNENPNLESMDTAPSAEEAMSVFLNAVEIGSGTPAELAGIQVGDEIIAIEGEELREIGTKLGDAAQSWEDEVKSFTVLRDGHEIELKIQPVLNEDSGKWFLGLGYEPKLKPAFLEGYEGEDARRFRMNLGEVNEPPIEAYIELAPDGGKEKKMRLEIKKYVLVLENEDGSFSEYDLVERFNTTETKIYFDPTIHEGKGGGFFEADNNEVVLGNPFSETGPHVLIHELRHADQHESGKFKDIDGTYIPALNPKYDNDEFWDERLYSRYIKEDLTKILSHIMNPSDVEKLLSTEEMSKLFSVLSEHSEVNGKIAKLGEEKVFAHPSVERRYKIDEELEELKAVSASIERPAPASMKIVGEITIRDILRIPALLIERDAEYGALVGLRAIKKETGIDFLTRLPKESEILKKDIENLDFSEQPELIEKMSERLDSIGEGEESSIMSIRSIRNMHAYFDKIGVSRGCLPALKQLRGSAESEGDDSTKGGNPVVSA